MSLKTICCSHTPLMHYVTPPGGVREAVRESFARLARRVESYAPELIIVFSPDHYHGFFYDMMPAFCVGAAAESINDYDTGEGALNVPEADAVALVEALRGDDMDAAISFRMTVDHGVAQPLSLLTGGLDTYPVIPIFVNCVAPPTPSCRRVRQLGEAVGRWARELERRVLFIGSGGLSHDPGFPDFSKAPPKLRETLIAGRHRDPEARRKREARTIEMAQDFISGKGKMQPLNESWDRDFLRLLEAGDMSAVDGFEDAWITEQGGSGGHEIRSWIAAFAALSVAGPYRTAVDFYQPIPEWVAGMGMVEAETA